MSDIALSIRNVSKCYQVFDSQQIRLLHTFWPKHQTGIQEVWALRGINIEIKKGEAVAIIGRNGSGKSTLLEIITGTLSPTIGEVTVNGRVSALLELGSGFNPEYIGRDNVILNGLLLGLTRKEILHRFDEIVSFADIGDAIDRPVKTYSSGMMMRLAFAVQVLTDPDILIIDEALSVGDFFFQQKCLSYIRRLCEKGVTLLFVSHDMGTVRDLCTKGLFLRTGKCAYYGDNMVAIRYYLSDQVINESIIVPTDQLPLDKLKEKQDILTLPCEALWTSQRQNEPNGRCASILAVGVDDGTGRTTLIAEMGSTIWIYVLYRTSTPRPTHVTVTIKNKYDQLVSVTGSYLLGNIPPPLRSDEVALFELQLKLEIEAGLYSFSVNLGVPDSDEANTGQVLDETPWLGPIHVTFDYQTKRPRFYGMFGLPTKSRFFTKQSQIKI